MLRIFHNTKYDFIRWWKVAVGLTVAFLAAGAVAIAFNGVQYSIEFTGGTLAHVKFKQAIEPGDIRDALAGAGIESPEIQRFGAPQDREFTVRVQSESAVATQAAVGAEKVAHEVENVLVQRFGAQNVEVLRTEAVGPNVGEELSRNALIALLISFVMIMIYLAIRFEWRFGLAAILATAHDTIATVAFLTLMNIEVSLTIVAALLTVIGYSLNDTIIIFDRVRENLRRGLKEPLYEVLNRSINETLPRSVLTHVLTALSTLALVLFAGDVIRPFAWVMLFGIVTGTFSSIYVAGPILLWIERKYPRAAPAWKPSSTATATSQTPRSTATATR